MASCENGNSELSAEVSVIGPLQDTPIIPPQAQPQEIVRLTQQEQVQLFPGQVFAIAGTSLQNTNELSNSMNKNTENEESLTPDNLPPPDTNDAETLCLPSYSSINNLQEITRIHGSPPPIYQDSHAPPSGPSHLLKTSHYHLPPSSCYESSPPSYQEIFPSKTKKTIPARTSNPTPRTILINVTELHDSRNPNWVPGLPLPPPGFEVAPPRNRSFRERRRYLQDLRRWEYVLFFSYSCPALL